MKNICDWNNCLEEGAYKAPIEKDNSKKFRLLCLTHVKEFNKNWNYFYGMNDEEIKKYINQVAFSSAEEFLTKYKKDNEEFIGHIGLGY